MRVQILRCLKSKYLPFFSALLVSRYVWTDVILDMKFFEPPAKSKHHVRPSIKGKKQQVFNQSPNPWRWLGVRLYYYGDEKYSNKVLDVDCRLM
jgi:hypothetical protein